MRCRNLARARGLLGWRERDHGDARCVGVQVASRTSRGLRTCAEVNDLTARRRRDHLPELKGRVRVVQRRLVSAPGVLPASGTLEVRFDADLDRV